MGLPVSTGYRESSKQYAHTARLFLPLEPKWSSHQCSHMHKGPYELMGLRTHVNTKIRCKQRIILTPPSWVSYPMTKATMTTKDFNRSIIRLITQGLYDGI